MSVWEYSLVKNNNNQKPYILKIKTKMKKVFIQLIFQLHFPGAIFGANTIKSIYKVKNNKNLDTLLSDI